MAVVGPSGKRLPCHVVETSAKQIISLLKTIPRPRLLSLEEGTQSAWLHETLSPHVDDLIVVGIRQQSRGPKDDRRDAFTPPSAPWPFLEDARVDNLRATV